MKEFLKDIASSVVYFMLGAITVLATLFFFGCNSFDPVVMKDQPDECNDYYTTLKFYVKTTDKDSAFVGTVFEKCANARAEKRKEIREEKCRKRFYADGAVEKDGRYVGYLECLK